MIMIISSAQKTLERKIWSLMMNIETMSIAITALECNSFSSMALELNTQTFKIEEFGLPECIQGKRNQDLLKETWEQFTAFWQLLLLFVVSIGSFWWRLLDLQKKVLFFIGPTTPWKTRNKTVWIKSLAKECSISLSQRVISTVWWVDSKVV